MIKRKKIIIKMLFLLLVLFFPSSILAQSVGDFSDDGIVNPALNPSVSYCEELGYKFVIENTPEGQKGVCKFSEEEQAPAWDFLKGKEATEKSYCSQEGYKAKIVDDPEKCGLAYSPGFGCLVCVLENGKEVETYNLMQSVKEKEKTAETPVVNNKKSNTNDKKVIDAKTTKDTKLNKINQNKTKTIKTSNFQIIIFIILFISIILIIFLAYFFLIRKKPKQGQE